MRNIFELKEKEYIENLLNSISYGTLALCVENKPYSVPVNFVYYKDAIYFHGSLKGKKNQMIKTNPMVSFSIVEDLSLIPSFFASDEGLACPATHFFASIIVEGKATFEDSLEQRADVLEALMQKLQKEGKYKKIENNSIYENMLKATNVIKIEIQTLSAKIKCAQHKSSDIQKKIIENLEQRGSLKDRKSLEHMKKYYK